MICLLFAPVLGLSIVTNVSINQTFSEIASNGMYVLYMDSMIPKLRNIELS